MSHRNGPSRGDAGPRSREELEALHGRVWSQEELEEEFTVTAIIDINVIARRKADDQVGTLLFQNAPRYYFGWQPHEATE